MRAKRRRAVRFLMTNSTERVAEMLGIRLTTLENWMSMDDFRAALREREREQKRSLARIARQAALNAAESLCDQVLDRAKPDAKIMLDLIKASAAFEAESEDPVAAIEEVLRHAREEMPDAV